jgi:hypothetical protein
MGTESVSSEGDRWEKRKKHFFWLSDFDEIFGKRSSRECVKLVRFFIFNSDFGPREGEEEKRIIFYLSENESEEKTKHVRFQSYMAFYMA